MGNTRKVPQRGTNRQVDLPYANFPRQASAPATPAAAGAHIYTFDSGGLTVLEGRTETGGRFRFLRDQADIGYNNTGATIPKGRLVRTTGSFTNPSDANDVWATIALADNASESTMFAMGMTTADIPNNSAGRIYSLGFVSGLDTSGLTAGATLYLGTSGAFTTTKPTAVGSCVQIVGDVMVVNATTGVVRLALASAYDVVAAASSGAAFDPKTSLRVYDDFVSGSLTSGGIGELGWGSTNGTNGSVAISGRPGVVQRISATTANTVVGTHLKNTNTTVALLGSDLFDITWSFRVLATSNVLGIRVGIADASGSNPPTNGVYAEKLPADTAFFGVSRAAGTETRATSGVTVVANQWHRVRVRRISSTQVGITVDNAAEVTSTTNLPTAGMHPFVHHYHTNTTSHTFEMDWFDMTITGLNR